MKLPPMGLVRQRCSRPAILDVGNAVRQTLDSADRFGPSLEGRRVGLALGSRGIDRLGEMVRATIESIEKRGGEVVVIPAMGSHGGATASGQAALLESLLGFLPPSIDPKLETVEVGELSFDAPFRAALAATEVDELLLLNRVRPHTMFTGPIESGLCKMLVVGLGKPAGAEMFHAAACERGFESTLRAGVDLLSALYPLKGGVAVVENALGKICDVEYLPAEDLWSREAELLEVARRAMPSLPFDDSDLLIIDEIGKDISGTGMDTSVIGTKRGSSTRPKTIFVRALSSRSAGNAYGLGYANMTTRAVIEKVDPQIAKANLKASGNPIACQIPDVYPTDRAAVEAALADRSADVRVLHIANTKGLGVVSISQTYADRLKTRSDLELVRDWGSVDFDAAGQMPGIPDLS